MKAKRVMDTEDEGKRTTYFIFIVGAIFLLLILRLFYLQILNGDMYREKAVKNSLRENIVKASRGKIYDRNGVVLADNSTGYKIIHFDTKTMSVEEKNILKQMFLNDKREYNTLKPKQKSKLDEIYFDISYISKISNTSFDEILDTFYKTPIMGIDKEITVVDDIPQDLAMREVEKLPNDRIDIVEYNKRSYPFGKLASHILGYVKLISSDEYKTLKESGYLVDDLIGKKGIEKQYDKQLKGINGQEFVEVDVKGNVIKKIDETTAIGGDNIYLSIDSDLQSYMTDVFAGAPGAFIAIDVNTGKILTFVSSPEIDSNLLSSKINQNDWNNLVNSKSTPLVNKGIAGLYPPGSTFKAVTGISFLESGINVNEGINSTGSFTYGGVTFRDAHSVGHGFTNFYKSIEQSVNSYYYNFIMRIPRDNFFRIAREFGIGQKTGIDLFGEQDGLLPTPDWKKKKFKKRQQQVWLPGDMINMSIGQGYLLLTPMQVLMIYQTIANDGVMLYPTLVDRFVDAQGNSKNNETKIRKKLNVNINSIREMQKALRLPVVGSGGTAKVLQLPYVTVAAKTGTAQNAGGNNHSWIAGYFPADKPKIAFVALVENGGYGGVAAGQKARAFIERYYKKGEQEIDGRK